MNAEGWENWTAHDPDFSEDIDDSILNHYMKFCLSVILLLSPLDSLSR